MPVIIFAILAILGSTVFVAPAKADVWCQALGTNPTMNSTKQVLWDAVINDVDSEAFATDIVNNCPTNYKIVMRAAKELHNQLSGE